MQLVSMILHSEILDFLQCGTNIESRTSTIQQDNGKLNIFTDDSDHVVGECGNIHLPPFANVTVIVDDESECQPQFLSF